MYILLHNGVNAAMKSRVDDESVDSLNNLRWSVGKGARASLRPGTSNEAATPLLIRHQNHFPQNKPITRLEYLLFNVSCLVSCLASSYLTSRHPFWASSHIRLRFQGFRTLVLSQAGVRTPIRRYLILTHDLFLNLAEKE